MVYCYQFEKQPMLYSVISKTYLIIYHIIRNALYIYTTLHDVVGYTRMSHTILYYLIISNKN